MKADLLQILIKKACIPTGIAIKTYNEQWQMDRKP
jgi:hypothetical protein